VFVFAPPVISARKTAAPRSRSDAARELVLRPARSETRADRHPELPVARARGVAAPPPHQGHEASPHAGFVQSRRADEIRAALTCIASRGEARVVAARAAREPLEARLTKRGRGGVRPFPQRPKASPHRVFLSRRAGGSARALTCLVLAARAARASTWQR
jgi:hypothetical protein